MVVRRAHELSHELSHELLEHTHLDACFFERVSLEGNMPRNVEMFRHTRYPQRLQSSRGGQVEARPP